MLGLFFWGLRCGPNIAARAYPSKTLNEEIKSKAPD